MKIFNGNTEILDITVNDESYRYRAIKGEHNLTLYFSLAEHVEIPVGAHCVYQNETFTLYSPATLDSGFAGSDSNLERNLDM